jgi:hypothetical protein
MRTGRGSALPASGKIPGKALPLGSFVALRWPGAAGLARFLLNRWRRRASR